MSILFFFLDGVGLGSDDESVNPFSRDGYAGFERLAGGRMTASAQPINEPGHVFYPIDANLGVEGLPQSGTGQATLFTGTNCASLVGRHFGPYPHSRTRDAIRSFNLFKQLGSQSNDDCLVAFANAYPDRFFTYAERAQRWTVTTQCCVDAGVLIRKVEDLRLGRAVAADLTRERFRAFDDTVEQVTEVEAASHLVALAAAFQFTLFEYYLTDKAGHSRSMARATSILSSADRALAAILDEIEGCNVTLIVTSDHGNIEDLSVKTHTRNAVPFAVVGPLARHFHGVLSLTHVTPAIVEALGACR